MKTTYPQQGDVLFKRCPIPKGEKTRRVVTDGIVMRGEATGHAHRLEEMSDGLLTEIDGVLYLDVRSDGARIVHEEHKPVALPVLPDGEVYRIDRVMEYDHFAEEAREVRD